MEYNKYTHNFLPIYNSDSRILILGSFPSVKSRENNFYYGHPQNRFWKVIAQLTNSEVPQSIEQKEGLLLQKGIAIWDVIYSCSIIGSSDSSIKDVVPNDIEAIVRNSGIKRIFANGATAGRLYNKYKKNTVGMDIVVLPSTSPANAGYSLQRLCDSWKIITEYE